MLCNPTFGFWFYWINKVKLPKYWKNTKIEAWDSSLLSLEPWFSENQLGVLSKQGFDETSSSGWKINIYKSNTNTIAQYSPRRLWSTMNKKWTNQVFSIVISFLKYFVLSIFLDLNCFLLQHFLQAFQMNPTPLDVKH